MALRQPELFLDNLFFPEGPRWRDGHLWFSDVLAGDVKRVDMTGNLDIVVSVPGLPSGLGWRLDGSLAVVSFSDGRLLELRDGNLSEIADMKALAGNPCNDMVITPEGFAYIGSMAPGLDEALHAEPGNMPGFGYIVCVNPDGEAFIAVERVTFPNGFCLTPDGKTLVFAESFGFRLTALDIEPDGTLVNRRVWADLGIPPDGICMDAEGCIWAAIPYVSFGGPGAYVRIAEGGEMKDRIDVEDYAAYACTLGGPEMTTLFLCESAVFGLERKLGDGRIRRVTVDVPGTGSP